jgi:hypothetical protein
MMPTISSNVDERRALRGQDAVGNQVAQAADMVGAAAQGRRENDRREDADTISAEILDEPRH